MPQVEMRAPPPRILFVTATRIGDAVLSTGVLSRLLERFPDSRLTIAAGPVAAPLFRGVPGLERLIALPKRRYAGHWLSLYRQVATTRWQLVADLRGSALPWLLRTSERWSVGKGDPSRHRLEHLARSFGLDDVPGPHLWTRATDEAAAARLVPPGAPVLGIAPTANWPGKIWRPERFAALIGRLTAPAAAFAGARVAVFASPSETALAAAVLASVPPERLIDMTREPDLLTVGAVLGRMSLVVANDTGLMHMAAAAGAPTLGLFGPSPATLYAPWGARCAHVQTVESYETLVEAPDFDHRTTGTLMDGLSVDAVEAAAFDLVRRTSMAA